MMRFDENGMLVRSEAFRGKVIRAKFERPECRSLPRITTMPNLGEA